MFNVRNLLLKTGDDGLSSITPRELLTNFNAIDFSLLVDGEFLAVEPDSASRPSDGGPSSYVWLLKKTTAAGGSSKGANREVAVFKLITVEVIEDNTSDIDVVFQQLVGEFN